jgi:hypothetical protein
MLPFLYATKNREISDRSFDAEATAIIGQAFDKAWKEMHVRGQPDSWKESIAKQLIEIAAGGERDPEKMSRSALISLGLIPNRFTIPSRRMSPLRARAAEDAKEAAV